MGEVVDVRGSAGESPGSFTGSDTTGSRGRVDEQERENPCRPYRLQPFDFEPEVGHRVVEIGEEPPDAIRPFVDAFDGRPRCLQLHGLRAAREIAVDVALIERGYRASDYFQILGWHPSPFSIATEARPLDTRCRCGRGAAVAISAASWRLKLLGQSSIASRR